MPEEKKRIYDLGIDLDRGCCRVSAVSIEDGRLVTLTVPREGGSESIPQVLGQTGGQWVIGRQAAELDEEENVVVRHLWRRAVRGESVSCGRETYRAVSLLALYLRRVLEAVADRVPAERVRSVTVTAPVMGRRERETLGQVRGLLKIEQQRFACISHDEALAALLAVSHPEAPQQGALGVSARPGELRIVQILCSTASSPSVFYARVTRQRTERGIGVRELDEALCRLLRRVCAQTPVRGIWFDTQGGILQKGSQTLDFACQGRRVFAGSDICSRGAASLPRAIGREEGFRFLEADAFPWNVRLSLWEDGEQKSPALLRAGTPYSELEPVSIDLILQGSTQLELSVEHLTDGAIRPVQIDLAQLPQEENFVTRVELTLQMRDQHTLLLQVRDLGFGELDPGQGYIWQKEIAL